MRTLAAILWVQCWEVVNLWLLCYQRLLLQFSERPFPIRPTAVTRLISTSESRVKCNHFDGCELAFAGLIIRRTPQFVSPDFYLWPPCKNSRLMVLPLRLSSCFSAYYGSIESSSDIRHGHEFTKECYHLR